MDPAEKDHEGPGEKAAQNARAITFTVFIGPRTVFDVSYSKITTDLEEPGSFGFSCIWKRLYARFCVVLF